MLSNLTAKDDLFSETMPTLVSMTLMKVNIFKDFDMQTISNQDSIGFAA